MLILERVNIVTTIPVHEAFRAVQVASQVFLNLIKVGYIKQFWEEKLKSAVKHRMYH
jgi:hypothetical protein